MKTFYQLMAVLRGQDSTVPVQVHVFENVRPSNEEIGTQLRKYQDKENKFVMEAYLLETFHLIDKNAQKADTERG